MAHVRYFRRVKEAGAWFKRCGYCGFGNLWWRGPGEQAEECSGCHRELVARPKRRRQLTLDQRADREEELLDEWLTKLALAVTKIRYYRARVKGLRREQRKRLGTSGVGSARAIRVRPEIN